MVQSDGNRPPPRLAALRRKMASWEVRAWNEKTTMEQNSSFFKEPLKQGLGP
jgi:hypothetical protein